MTPSSMTAEEEPGCASFIGASIIAMIVVWMILVFVASVPSWSEGTTGDFNTGLECAAENDGGCVMVVTNKDCSPIPGMTCREWVPLSELVEEKNGE